jgi:ketosteroid isomerase-like protein
MSSDKDQAHEQRPAIELQPRELLMTSASHVLRHACLLATAVAAACSSPKRESTTDQTGAARASVDRAAGALLAALRNDSPDSLLALMADDVVIMPPNEPALRGKAAVRAWYGQFVGQMHTRSLDITHREVFVGGDYATEVAEFAWTLVPVAGGASIVDRGSYVQLWHRTADGRWVFSREVWNSAMPAGG